MSKLNVVDLSSNNGIVSIAKLKQSGCDAVIIKATEGTGYVNPYFVSQVKEAINLGMCVGAYHFFSGTDYKGNVDNYWRHVKPYNKYLRHFADYEGNAITLGGVGYGLKVLKYMEKLTGKKPMIYMGLSDENYHDWSSCKNYGLWVAQYNNFNPVYGFHPRTIYGSVRHFKKMAMFQYTSTGSIGGYYPLDLSVFYGSKSDWQKNSKGGSVEMENWHAPVKFTDLGAFRVTKKTGATKWSEPNNKKKVGMAKSGSIYRITKAQNGFFKIAGKDEWFDGRTGDFRANPICHNNRIHGVVTVVESTSGHAELTTRVTGVKFKVGTNWKISGYDSFKTENNTWTWAIVGVGNNRYINLDKCRVIV